jgi:hypothetical protein
MGIANAKAQAGKMKHSVFSAYAFARFQQEVFEVVAS